MKRFSLTSLAILAMLFVSIIPAQSAFAASANTHTAAGSCVSATHYAGVYDKATGALLGEVAIYAQGCVLSSRGVVAWTDAYMTNGHINHLWIMQNGTTENATSSSSYAASLGWFSGGRCAYAIAVIQVPATVNHPMYWGGGT